MDAEGILGTVLEKALNEIYVFDESTLRFIEVNRGARENLGYTIDELRGLTPLDIKPEMTRESFDELLEPLRSDQTEKIEFTTFHRRKDGTDYPVEVHLQRSLFESSPVFVAIILDITERARAERELRDANTRLGQRVEERTRDLQRSERDYRAILDALPDALFLVDGSGLIDLVARQAGDLFGYTRDEFLGKSIEFLVPERFRDTHVAHRKQFDGAPSVRSMGQNLELFGLHKDGTEFPIDVNLSPVQLHGRNLTAASVRDVTERHESAAALSRALAAANDANIGKSRFLAAASHDLRQPLQATGLYLDVLLQRSGDEAVHEVGAKINQSLAVMGELLDALLDISKLDSGSVVPEITTFPVQNVLNGIVAAVSPQAQERGLSLLAPPSTFYVRSDRALLQRIVENFVTNAVRYTDEGEVRLLCTRVGGDVRIDVTDTGIGIPDDALGSIFEEYMQLDNPVRDRRKGLGLGLSIVKQIARLLDHDIGVVSEPGVGSTFSISVPGVAAPKEVEDPTSRAKAHSTSKVLFVDDDPAIVDAIEMMLEGAGLDVRTALDGDAALALIDGGFQPDILISDYRLPGYDGVEVTRRVRERTRADLPTIIMTGDTSAQEIQMANLSRCRVLHKPVDTQSLMEIIGAPFA